MASFEELGKELADHPGRYALVIGEQGREAIAAMVNHIASEVVSVGRRLTMDGDLPGNIQAALAKAELMVDLDILFAPQLHLDPLDLLRDLARRQPVLVAAWPGKIEGGQATYSEPGRRDYYRRGLENVLVLRPRPQVLPGPPKFDVERFQ